MLRVLNSYVSGYDMMADGGQQEGGDGVQTKNIRTEINGGASAASDPANFEVLPTVTQLKHCQSFLIENLFSSNMYFKTLREILQLQRRAGMYRRENSGVASLTSYWLLWAMPLG